MVRFASVTQASLRPESVRFRSTGVHPSCEAAGHTKAQVVVPVRRRVPVAVRRPAVLCRVVPTAAPVHPVRALGPLTVIPCNTWPRNRQLFTPPALVKATRAVTRCWYSLGPKTSRSNASVRSSNLRRKRRRLLRFRQVGCAPHTRG